MRDTETGKTAHQPRGAEKRIAKDAKMSVVDHWGCEPCWGDDSVDVLGQSPPPDKHSQHILTPRTKKVLERDTYGDNGSR